MYWKVLGASVIFIFIQHTARVIHLMGYHHTVFDHAPGPCHTLEEVVGGSMDLRPLKDGLVLMSSGYSSLKAERGRLFMFDVNRLELPAREVTLTGDLDVTTFWPHGIGVWQHPDTDETTLFIVSHHPGGDRIEKFSFNHHHVTAEHIETIKHPAIRLASRVEAIDTDRFYFTNTFYGTTRAMTLLEFGMMFSWGTLVYYDGAKAKVMERMFTPNGLALSRDRKFLFVASSGSKKVKVFKRKEDNSLTFVSSMHVEAYLQGLNVDVDTGAVWLSAVNSAAEYDLHDNNPTIPCGSRVFRIQADAFGNLTDLQEAYANSGPQLSCSTSVSHYRGNLLVGALHKPPLLCQVNAL